MVVPGPGDERTTIGGARLLALDREVLRVALAPTLHLIASVTSVELVQLSLFDVAAQHIVCHTGAPGTVPATLPRGAAPCEFVVQDQAPLWLAQTPHLPGTSDAAPGPSYVGVPVLGADGSAVGSLCGVGAPDRTLSNTEFGQWQGFAAVIADQLELLALRADADIDHVGDPTAAAVTPREITAGIAAGQFLPWFQPVIDLTTGERTGFEALARWQHPTRGLLLPADFVPVAERSELIVDLDADIWRQAITAAARLRRIHPQLRMAVNFSARHTEAAHSPDRLSALAAAAGVPTTAIDVEITETTHLAASGHGIAVLAELRERGFTVLLDDFGTGWSTITSLLDLPHDGLKVDRGLTSRSHTPNGRAALAAIVGAAHTRGARTVAEGVETAEQARTLADLGYDHGQGYHWGRPAPARGVAGHTGT